MIHQKRNSIIPRRSGVEVLENSAVKTVSPWKVLSHLRDNTMTQLWSCYHWALVYYVLWKSSANSRKWCEPRCRFQTSSALTAVKHSSTWDWTRRSHNIIFHLFFFFLQLVALLRTWRTKLKNWNWFWGKRKVFFSGLVKGCMRKDWSFNFRAHHGLSTSSDCGLKLADIFAKSETKVGMLQKA